jgi:hypothetical protein
MATPHADVQDFRCSGGSGNPKTVRGVWVRRVDELSRVRRVRTSQYQHQVANNNSPSVMRRWMESAAADWVALAPAAGLDAAARGCGFAGLSEGGPSATLVAAAVAREEVTRRWRHGAFWLS